MRLLLFQKLMWHAVAMNGFSLMIHGGAGAVHAPERFEGSLGRVIEAGANLLKGRASALDAVTYCVVLLEDDPIYNAGRGNTR
jgi:beta-aspartyl-peptidase (threonine type)